MQQTGMAGGETTLSREINPRDRRCFQRIISFGSESWPPAGCLAAIFSLTLYSFLFLYLPQNLFLSHNFCSYAIPAATKRSVTKRKLMKFIWRFSDLGDKINFSLFEGGNRTFPGKSDATGLGALTDVINRQSRTERGEGGGTATYGVTGQNGTRVKKKIRSAPSHEDGRENGVKTSPFAEQSPIFSKSIFRALSSGVIHP